MYRFFLNFLKSFISSCLSKFYNNKNFNRAVFEIYALEAEIKGVSMKVGLFIERKLKVAQNSFQHFQRRRF